MSDVEIFNFLKNHLTLNVQDNWSSKTICLELFNPETQKYEQLGDSFYVSTGRNSDDE